MIKITLIEKPGSLTHGWSDYYSNIGIAVGFFLPYGMRLVKRKHASFSTSSHANENPITPDFHRLTKQLSGFLWDVIISFLNLPLFWYVWPL